jgi:repressor LexA
MDPKLSKKAPGAVPGPTSNGEATEAKGKIMPDMSTLTHRQREIYDFIKEKIETRGYGPTVREIGTAFDIRSPNGVMCHLKALEKKGLILREEFSARAIQLVDYKHSTAELPLLGNVAAGQPFEPAEQQERLDFNDLFGGKDHFALQVRGQSMIEDHIDDGDFVVIRKQDTAQSGERVVAMIDNEVTLKRFHMEKGRIRLDPANSTMKPIYVDPSANACILGVLIGVLRKC